MAKLTGPILSFGAKGQIGKTIVTADWRGIKYARQYTVPANPNTAAQIAVRSVFTFLSSFWLNSPTLFRAPWAANAVGRSYTDRNKLVAENLNALNLATDLNDFIGSPGALGGPPLDSITITTGTTPGGVDWSATPPTAPTGWTLASVVAVAFPDQDAHDAYEGPIVAQEDTTSTYGGNLAGFAEGIVVQVVVWPVWTRPDGKTAYGPSLIDTCTTDVT